MTKWYPDFLGDEYFATTIPLADDDQGSVVATLIRHRPLKDASEAGTTRRFALLAVHGWNDYFYHTDFAQAVTAMGGRFYALDLRRYGRSHREGQPWGYVSDLTTYDEEIGAATDIIRSEEGEGVPIILYGHSTGGLTTTLWAHRHASELAGLILNSPWLEYQDSVLARQLGKPLIDALARFNPTKIISSSDNGFYQRTLTGWKAEDGPMPIHTAGDPFFEGGWKPDPRFRHFPTFPVRAGWLSAVLAGHAKVARGLNTDLPTLVLTSAQSSIVDVWAPNQRSVDGVLDVELIWQRAAHISTHTTIVKLSGAIHDVMLSRAEVRQEAYNQCDRWISAFARLP
ncbi:alpha/beta hydrolase [Arcanobacterium phocisimile]|uniref:Alpha/beta hydrolase n=1 Tax=Arcanobacterium phocisimile TaxID=1302235 RepID=A0ABX7IIQ1_9ACTO|nr:alpha/beta hydrolase [Arcanobacterium phocisimile]QRV02409.1 alpha/beta hydrolase [Arcanobacterium phocisimile]